MISELDVNIPTPLKLSDLLDKLLFKQCMLVWTVFDEKSSDSSMDGVMKQDGQKTI